MLLVIEIAASDRRAVDRELSQRGAEIVDVTAEREGVGCVMLARGPSVYSAEEACAAVGAAAIVWEAKELGSAQKPADEASGQSRVVVERRFAEPVTEAEIRDREARGGWCLDLHGVRFLKSYLSRDRRRMLCFYSAPDLESVRVSQRTVGLPVERVWGEADADPRAEAPAAARLTITDTTLRDGLTGRRVGLGVKHRCFALLDAMGFDAIEIGMTTAARQTDDDFSGVPACIERAVACVLSHPDAAAIERAGKVLAECRRGRLSVYNPVADPASIESAGADTTLGLERLEEIRKTVRRGCDVAAQVQWSALDATRANAAFLSDAVAAAIDAGAEIINIADTRGRALPNEIETIFETLRSAVPDIADVRLSVHCHDDLHLATANVLTAVQHGARQCECTIDGLGPQGGNTSLQQVVGAIRSRAETLGLVSSVDISACEAIAAALAEA